MLDLLDWRRRVADLYRTVRDDPDEPEAVAARFRASRSLLFREHPQTPLTERQLRGFVGLPYSSYSPTFRVTGTIEPAESGSFEIPVGDDGSVRIDRIGRVRFELAGQPLSLSLFWITGYGGGLFLPFRDATNGRFSYGGGRYLYDTIKGADLGGTAEGFVLDFNYAYNPSCAYDNRWVCPLSPPENTLPIAIPAGEMVFSG